MEEIQTPFAYVISTVDNVEHFARIRESMVAAAAGEILFG
jgi:hypothetical protein